MPTLITPCGGGSSPGTGSWVLLSRTTLAVDGTFDESNISQAYDDLILVLIARGTRVGTADFLQMRLNNDSGPSYSGQYIEGSTVSGSAGFNGNFQTSSARISGSLTAASADTNFFSTFEIVIPGYTSSTWVKAGFVSEGDPLLFASSQTAGVGSFVWNSTAAVNRVRFFGGTTANFLTGSQLRIYAR